MSENLNGLFVEAGKDAVHVGARSLAGTAQLTSTAMKVADAIIKTAFGEPETYGTLVAASKIDHNATDALINRAYDLTAIDLEFLKVLDDDTLEGMLKSQQSKRSRTKGKPMTLDNYKNMLVGAVGEMLIRMTTEKTKQIVRRRFAGTLEFTEEQLATLSEDQELLRKEVRNIQSRKSIMKSKDDFDETSEAWLKLLAAEESLKSVRVTTRVDSTKTQLATLLGEVDISQLKAAEAKALLEQAMGLIKTARKEETTNV